MQERSEVKRQQTWGNYHYDFEEHQNLGALTYVPLQQVKTPRVRKWRLWNLNSPYAT